MVKRENAGTSSKGGGGQEDHVLFVLFKAVKSIYVLFKALFELKKSI